MRKFALVRRLDRFYPGNFADWALVAHDWEPGRVTISVLRTFWNREFDLAKAELERARNG